MNSQPIIWGSYSPCAVGTSLGIRPATAVVSAASVVTGAAVLSNKPTVTVGCEPVPVTGVSSAPPVTTSPEDPVVDASTSVVTSEEDPRVQGVPIESVIHREEYALAYEVPTGEKTTDFVTCARKWGGFFHKTRLQPNGYKFRIEVIDLLILGFLMRGL